MSHSEDRGQEAPRRSEPGFRRRLLTFNLLLFGVLSAAVFAMGTSLWLLLTPTLAQRLQNDTRYLADRLGKSLDVAAAAHDPKLVQEALREFEDDPDFHGMVVFQEDGGVLFEYPEGFSTREIGLHEVSPSQVFETRDHFAAWSPISVEGVPLGTVVVAYSKESLHMLGDWFMVFAAVVALFLVASILYALRFDVRFVAPFRQLSVFAGRIGEGHLDARLEPALGAAESRDLVRELNRMAEQLQSQHEALVAAREEALGASRAKSRFLANMSHEIRTPLNGVLGTADVMLTGPLPPDVRADVEMIRLSASGLLAIIEEILDLAKIEADRLSVEAVSTDLADVLHGAVAAVVPQVRKKGLALTARMLPGVPRFILSDGLRVRQILTNLLGNAAKFTEEGAIELTVAVQDDLLRFDVRDDGIGMTATQLEVVFEAFRQADTTTTRRYGGTGLGLAISQRLAQLLGGRLWADSEPGVGSTFHLELPLVPGSDAGLDAPPPAVVLGRAAEADQLRARFEAQGLPTAAPEPMVAVVCLSEPEEVEDFTEVLAEVRARGGKAVAVLPPDTLSARRLLEQGAVDLTLTEPVFPSQVLERAMAVGTEEILEEGPAGARLRVLLAEDNPVNQKVATRMLGRLGHEVRVAGDGQQVLDALSEASAEVDVVLMDLHMPIMDGIEATRALRRAGYVLPVIALTADAMRGTDALCRSAGMDGYLAKPLQIEDLRRTLAPLLRGEHAVMATHAPTLDLRR